MHLVDRTQHLFDLSDLCLVLQIDTGVEIGDHGVGQATQHFIFGAVDESSDL
jgi:hypothetical protein